MRTYWNQLLTYLEKYRHQSNSILRQQKLSPNQIQTLKRTYLELRKYSVKSKRYSSVTYFRETKLESLALHPHPRSNICTPSNKHFSHTYLYIPFPNLKLHSLLPVCCYISLLKFETMKSSNKKFSHREIDICFRT